MLVAPVESEFTVDDFYNMFFANTLPSSESPLCHHAFRTLDTDGTVGLLTWVSCAHFWIAQLSFALYSS